MKEEMAMALSRKYIGFLQRHRYVILLAAALLTFLSLQAMKQMHFDNSDESFFQEGDPAVQAIERYRELFGNEVPALRRHHGFIDHREIPVFFLRHRTFSVG